MTAELAIPVTRFCAQRDSVCAQSSSFFVTAKMVNNCCVCGCTNYVGKKPGLRFFRFPLADKERCKRWTIAVRRENWEPKKHSRICGEHFVTGWLSSI